MEIQQSDKTVTIEINEKYVDFLVNMLSAEECRLRNNLLHLNRKDNDVTADGKTTWWSSGCKIQPEYAANIMYDTLERLAMIECINKQITE